MPSNFTPNPISFIKFFGFQSTKRSPLSFDSQGYRRIRYSLGASWLFSNLFFKVFYIYDYINISIKRFANFISNLLRCSRYTFTWGFIPSVLLLAVSQAAIVCRYPRTGPDWQYRPQRFIKGPPIRGPISGA